MAVKITEDLLEPVGLAQDIYSCWRELMMTDQVEGGKNWPTWISLSAEWRRTLIEAVKMTVTAQLCKTQDALDHERAIDEAFAENRPASEPRDCYVCERTYETGVKFGVFVCADCRRAHV